MQTALWGGPGLRFEPRTGSLEAGTLTTRPQHLLRDMIDIFRLKCIFGFFFSYLGSWPFGRMWGFEPVTNHGDTATNPISANVIIVDKHHNATNLIMRQT